MLCLIAEFKIQCNYVKGIGEKNAILVFACQTSQNFTYFSHSKLQIQGPFQIATMIIAIYFADALSALSLGLFLLWLEVVRCCKINSTYGVCIYVMPAMNIVLFEAIN